MKKVLLLGVAVLAAGCGSSRVYLNRDVTTVLVLIPFNESTATNNAALSMWTFVEREVGGRGYRLVPHEKVGAFYDSKKYTDPGQIQEWSTDELAKEFEADAVVWSHLIAWEQKTAIVYNEVEVRVTAELRVRDGSKDGLTVWNGEGADGYTSTASGKGMLTGFIQTKAADPGKYAPAAAAKCFRELPWSGWDPETPRTPAK